MPLNDDPDDPPDSQPPRGRTVSVSLVMTSENDTVAYEWRLRVVFCTLMPLNNDPDDPPDEPPEEERSRSLHDKENDTGLPVGLRV